MKLLLHTCCGPCFIYPYKMLKKEGFQVDSYFYNPNIQPFIEYKNRRGAVKKATEDMQASVIYPEYDFREFFRAIDGISEKPNRCNKCWRLRLERTARFAKEKNYEYFSTTLLVSPYQDIESIKKIGDSLASKFQLKFYFKDFRIGFRDAHNEAKEKDIYCQKYCGCLYSEFERYK